MAMKIPWKAFGRMPKAGRRLAWQHLSAASARAKPAATSPGKLDNDRKAELSGVPEAFGEFEFVK